MDRSIAQPPKTTRELETALFEQLRLRRAEWARASEANRDLARQRFMDALDAFIRLVLYELW